MKKVILLTIALVCAISATAQDNVLQAARKTNDYFMNQQT